MIRFRPALMLALACVAAPGAAAQTPAAAPHDGWARVDVRDLDAIRAGSDAGTDFSIALGIQRAVWNGDGWIWADAGAGAALNPAVVQNRLDDQELRIRTVIDATVTESAVWRAIGLRSALQDTVAGTLRR